MSKICDRNYSGIFEQGKEQKNVFPSSAKVLESRLKLLKRMPVTAITKTRIKIVQRMLEQTPVVKELKKGAVIPQIRIDHGKVKTKDGVELHKASNEYKGHIFYDENGGKYKCLGYFPKLEDCVYLDIQTGNEVVGCMSGFYYNDPTKK